MSATLQAMLYVPGSEARTLAKIPDLPARSCILDLEDSVPASAKDAARALVAAAIESYGEGRTLYVRVNGVETGLARHDLAAVVRPGLAGIVLPKAESPDDMRAVDEQIAAIERERGMQPGGIDVIATIESASALAQAGAIAAASTRVRRLAFGAGDISAELGIEWPPANGEGLDPTLLVAKAQLVLASAAAGLDPPHDGASGLINDLAALRREAEEARRLGFGGKHAIHPAQVTVIEAAFAPMLAPRARERLPREAEELPLAGLRVLDLSSLYAAPLIATNLADFGADVVKIEHPRGDDARRFGLEKDGVPLWWKSVARNKRLVELDLNREDDREVVRRLAAHADVLIENFRPGRMESWGLGPAELRRANAGLVYVRVTGFGQTGPRSAEPGFGTLAEAFSGFASITGRPDGPPTLPPFGLADGVAGLTGTYATMIALYWRDARGGEGQVIDLSLYEPLFAILGPQLAEYQHRGVVQQRQGNRSQRTSPRNAYRTHDDRWVAISAGTQQIADRVLRAIEQPELVGDPRFADSAARRANADELDTLVATWIEGHDLAHVLERFAASEAPIAPVYDAAQIFDDPHYRARGSFVETPDADLGTVAMAAVVPRLSRTPGSIRYTGATAIGADSGGVEDVIAAWTRQSMT